MRYTTLSVLIQYASLRFGWKISDGAAFYSETAIVSIILYSLIIPHIVLMIRERSNVPPQVIDQILMRVCVGLLATGALLLGLAPVDKMLYFDMTFQTTLINDI
ncbi:hypothetical protein WAI453_009314 [Rhynchosporium graminicola]